MTIKDLIKKYTKQKFDEIIKSSRIILRQNYTEPVLQLSKTEDAIRFYSGSSIENPVELTYIEQTTSSIFKNQIEYLTGFYSNEDVPDYWRFIFICSDKFQNDLSLKQIILDKEIMQDEESLVFWSKIFNTDYCKNLFDSNLLSPEQSERLTEVLYDSEIVDKRYAVTDILKVNFNENLTYKLIIKSSEDIVVNLIKESVDITKKDFTANTTIIRLVFRDFISFCKKQNIEEICKSVKSINTPNEMKIGLICTLFNMFYKQNNNAKSIVMEKLDFSEYDIDIDKIYNKETIDILKSHDDIRQILKFIIKNLCMNYYKLKPDDILDNQFITSYIEFKNKFERCIEDEFTKRKSINIA